MTDPTQDRSDFSKTKAPDPVTKTVVDQGASPESRLLPRMRAGEFDSGGGVCADPVTKRVTLDVWAERARQDAKWGPNRNMSFEQWLPIFLEELGEASRAKLETGACMRKANDRFLGIATSGDRKDDESAARSYQDEARDWRLNMREELVQATATLHAMVECGDRYGWFI